MLAAIHDGLVGQYGAALRMLAACLKGADAAAWGAPVGKFAFWHVAYHTLFSTDLYLSPSERAFEAPALHRADYNFLGQQPWPPFKTVVAELLYEKTELLAYLDSCQAKMKAAVAAETEETLAGPSGFSWLPFTRLELHLYNIRHLSHHTGQLGAVLRRLEREGAGWVRSGSL